MNDNEMWTHDMTNENEKNTSTEDLAALEAALFLLREPTPGRRLATLAALPEGSKIRELVKQLNARYQREGSAFCAVEVAGGWQLRTLPQYAPWLFRLQEIPIEVRLSNTAMETLAIVAYQQPVARARIESIRGVRCGDILRQLLDQDLIRIAGHADELGRPFLYGTTKRFLQVFGLMRVEDLGRGATSAGDARSE
ncbi:MAG: SMC-Scp complex subunit ScpB [Planctomycetia bacterium]|nr:SMC-Scp complex subunit ScpB [Planctomycetia bacterium]